jgi:CheY-like chemotaxis protein
MRPTQGVFLLLSRDGIIPMSRQSNSPQLVVLVVEDEWMLRDAIVHYLQDAGCLVFEAESGEDALSVLDNEQEIDVLLTDIRLNGGMSGWQVGNEVRRRDAGMPVIYASAQPAEPPRQVPGSLFFRKPYNPSEILRACEQLADARRADSTHH